MNKSLFIINPSGNLLNSSTFTGSSFQITNSNLSEQNIVKVSIDLSTAIFPDLVFDPNGEAGDSVAKGFTVDGGLFTGVDSHSFTNERDGGFDVLNINFTNFNPGETLKFSLDIDPTSTKNTSPPGPGESGSVSGLELVGSTISVEYENGDTLTGQVYQISGSEIGSQIDLTPNLTTAPMIEVVDITITSATVEDANQTVRITGTVGSEVSLLIIEGAFFTEDGVGFDADPFEANTAIAVDEITATIGAEGFVDVPVTLTRSNPDGGLNYFKAAYVDQNGNAISYVSETVIMELDSELTPPTDSEAPSASLNASELTAASSDPYSFSVTYLDNVGIELATIDESDITVTAPDGVVLPITGVEVNTNSNSASTTATYSIEAPGGDWDEADNGEYTVALNESQVSDTNSNSVASGNLGSFEVAISQTPPSPPSGNTIRVEVEDYKAGTNGVEYFDTTANNKGGAYRTSEPVDIQVTGDVDGEYNIGYVDGGEYTTYDVNIPVTGEYDLIARVATASKDNKKLDITIGEQTYRANFTNTGGWQTYRDVVIPGVTLNAGVQELRLDMVSPSFNLNYIELVSQQPIGPDETPPSASLETTLLTFLPNSNNNGKFAITYLDNVGIELATIDESDITVTAPDGVVLPITGVEVNTNSNSASTTATYSIEAPGGDWDEADNGEYTVALNESQVSDINSNSLSAETLGSFTVDITTPSSDGVIRINAGSSQDAIDSSGNLWQADTFFVGGQILGPVNTSIADTTNDFIYQVQRADDSFSYAIPVDNGNYNINLHLSELTYTDFNQRSFDVSAEGELVFDNLDIFGETKNAFLDGTNTAKVLTVPAFSIVRDGELNLDFDSVLQDATIAGIEISPIVGSQVLIKENGDTVVSEGGNSDSYTVVLNSQPTADVTIDLQLGSDLSADKTSLLFTSENWSVPQTVNLTAVDDSSEEGFETTTIAHTINTSDPNYSDLTVPSVSVDINDNDSVEIKFDKKTVANLESPTTGAWGPDGRLYVGTINGEIKAYTFDDNYNVTDEQTINALTGVSNPSILGIAFNPFETTANGQPKIYVSHSQLYANGGTGFDPLTEFSPYSGQVSVLEGPDFTAQPLITGIGVSNHDHGVNGLEFDNEGNLLIAVGGNTNAGIADDAIGGIDESPFTAAILKAEISQPDFNGNIEYELPADWTAPEGLTLPNPEDSQGFGGIVNVASGVDVSVYASGFRNPYDLTLTTKGLLYATENGANADFGDVSTGANSQEPFTKDVKDELNLVVEDGYYGHPNRNRGRNDSRQNVYYAPSDSSNSDHTAPIYDYFVASTNGITEYRATTFSSQLRGNLLAQKWKNILYNVELSSDGTEVLDVGTLKTQPNNNVYAASGLDVLTGAGGEILGIDYTRDEITVATPIDNTAAGMTAYDILQWRAPATGGSEFTIGGVNFSGSTADTTVTIGNEVATITSVSEQRITGILPSFTDSGDSLLDITVQSNDEVSTITDAFQPIFG